MLLFALPLAAQENEELRLAMSGGYQPFSMTDENNQLVGFDADIASEVATRLGYTPKLIQTEWQGIAGGLKTGKYELICGSQAITQPRLQQMHFSLPYYVSGAQVFVLEGTSELRGLRIGVTGNTTYSDHIEAHPETLPDSEIQNYGSEAEILTALATDKIDAFVSDRIIGAWYVRQNSSDVQVVPFGELLYRESCGIAASKTPQGAALLQRVNAALLSIVQDGTYVALYNKWIGEDPDLSVLFAAWGDHADNIPSSGAAVELEETKPGFIDDVGDMVPLFFKGAWITIQLSVLTAIFALILGTIIGVGSAAGGKISRWISGAYITLVRGTPLLMQLFIAYFAVATAINITLDIELVGAFGAALLALVVNTGAYNAETIRGGILSVDRGQWEAAASLGMSRRKTLTRVVLPQAFRNSVASLGNNLVVLIKDTSLVGAITLIELTYTSRNIMSQTGKAFLPFIVGALFYLVIITLLDLGRKGWERRLMRSTSGKAATA
jgi:His/Glu/Gln/Arg/opine family amino acid ABC transporter permease subunit